MSTFSSLAHVGFIEEVQAEAMWSDEAVARWYADMTPFWTSLEPPLRRRLVLRVHQWITDTAVRDGQLRDDAIDDLGPGGPLAAALAEVIPAERAQTWQPWLRDVLHGLRGRLRERDAGTTEAWWERLFLLPCYAPTRSPRRRASMGSSTMPRERARMIRAMPRAEEAP